MSEIKSINLRAPINDLGYGIVGQNILLELCKRGVEVAYFPIGQPRPSSKLEADVISQSIGRQPLYNWESPCLNIWHQFNMAESIGRGMRCGYPIFEINKFTGVERHQLASLDVVFVTSKWAKEVVEQEVSNVKVVVAPLGVDTSIFYPQKISPNKKTVFLNIGKWSINKGHDILIDIFNEAFPNGEAVCLWMMNDNPFLTEQETAEWQSLYKNKLGDKVEFLPRVRTQAEVANVMNSVDCGIFPSRAEGANLEIIEMMACGKHVIATNYSGHTEFCTFDNSLLIQVDKLEEAYDGKWFLGCGIANVGEWAYLGDSQVEQAVCHLRTIHQQKLAGRLGINKEGVETAKKFSWSNCVDNIVNNIN